MADEEMAEAPKKRRMMSDIFGDDDDDDDDDDEPAAEEAPPAPQPSMNDLFGDSDDEEEEKKEEAKEEEKKEEKTKLMSELFGDSDNDDEEKAAETKDDDESEMRLDEVKAKETVERTKDELEIALPMASRKNGEAVVVKVPKKVVEFDPVPYEAGRVAAEEEKVSVVRWRYKMDPATGKPRRGRDGKPIKESNAKLVKYTDGSMQFVVGGDRYDVTPRAIDQPTRVMLPIKPRDGKQVLVSVGPRVKTQWTLAPPSLQSDAHKRFKLKAKERAFKTSKIKEIFVTDDPVKAQQNRIKLRDDAIRRAAKRRSLATETTVRPKPSMTANFLEYDDDDNLKSIKSRARSGSRSAGERPRRPLDSDDEDEDGFIVSDDHVDLEDDSDDEDEAPRRRSSRGLTKKKKQQDDDDDDDDDDKDLSDDDDDDEDNFAPPVNPAKRKARRVIDDDDDDDDDA